MSMRVTKFMVDKTQPKGSMKVGNQWRPGFDRDAGTFLPERRVDDYSWKWDTEPKSDLPRKPMAFDVVAIRDTEDMTYKLAFECFVIAPAQLGQFEIVNQSEAGIATLTTQPDPATKTPGLITIDFSVITREDLTGYFQIAYTFDGDDKPTILYSVGVKPDRDWMYAPMIKGPFERSKGRWVDAQ